MPIASARSSRNLGPSETTQDIRHGQLCLEGDVSDATDTFFTILWIEAYQIVIPCCLLILRSHEHGNNCQGKCLMKSQKYAPDPRLTCMTRNLSSGASCWLVIDCLPSLPAPPSTISAQRSSSWKRRLVCWGWLDRRIRFRTVRQGVQFQLYISGYFIIVMGAP